MKLYFYSPEQKNEKLQQNCGVVLSTLKNAGVVVVASYDEQHLTDFSKEDLEKINMTGENLLDKMDGLIIEASHPDSEVGYLLAYAISQKKPTLYIYEKGTSTKGALLYLSSKNIPDFIWIKPYLSNDLEKIILEFINKVETGERQEIPSIKFTLRITPQMERYLTWKAQKLGRTKADFLREFITDEVIKKDIEFQEYIKKKGNKLD